MFLILTVIVRLPLVICIYYYMHQFLTKLIYFHMSHWNSCFFALLIIPICV